MSRTAKCTKCGKPVDLQYRPFCSKRCADVDLSRWLGGKYAIPAVEPPDEWDMASAQAGATSEKDDDITRH